MNFVVLFYKINARHQIQTCMFDMVDIFQSRMSEGFRFYTIQK